MQQSTHYKLAQRDASSRQDVYYSLCVIIIFLVIYGILLQLAESTMEVTVAFSTELRELPTTQTYI